MKIQTMGDSRHAVVFPIGGTNWHINCGDNCTSYYHTDII